MATNFVLGQPASANSLPGTGIPYQFTSYSVELLQSIILQLIKFGLLKNHVWINSMGMNLSPEAITTMLAQIDDETAKETTVLTTLTDKQGGALFLAMNVRGATWVAYKTRDAEQSEHPGGNPGELSIVDLYPGVAPSEPYVVIGTWLNNQLKNGGMSWEGSFNMTGDRTIVRLLTKTSEANNLMWTLLEHQLCHAIFMCLAMPPSGLGLANDSSDVVAGHASRLPKLLSPADLDDSTGQQIREWSPVIVRHDVDFVLREIDYLEQSRHLQTTAHITELLEQLPFRINGVIAGLEIRRLGAERMIRILADPAHSLWERGRSTKYSLPTEENIAYWRLDAVLHILYQYRHKISDEEENLVAKKATVRRLKDERSQ